MTHLSWKPILSIEEINDEIEDVFRRLVHDKWGGESADWRPSVDIYETDDAYLLTADLPGVKPGDMGVEVHRRRITLSGQRCFQIQSRDRREMRIEKRLRAMAAALKDQRALAVEHAGVGGGLEPKQQDPRPPMPGDKPRKLPANRRS